MVSWVAVVVIVTLECFLLLFFCVLVWLAQERYHLGILSRFFLGQRTIRGITWVVSKSCHHRNVHDWNYHPHCVPRDTTKGTLLYRTHPATYLLQGYQPLQQNVIVRGRAMIEPCKLVLFISSQWTRLPCWVWILFVGTIRNLPSSSNEHDRLASIYVRMQPMILVKLHPGIGVPNQYQRLFYQCLQLLDLTTTSINVWLIEWDLR